MKIVLCLLLCSVSFASCAGAATVYNFTSFDGPGNNAGGTTINGISNNGVVVGFSSDNAANPTLLTNFLRTPAGRFTTLNVNHSPLGNANGVNASNVVVGASNDNSFSLDTATNTFVTLPPAKPGDTGSQATFGINDHLVIVGQYVQNSTDTVPGFVDKNGQFTTFQATNTATVTNVQSINNNGLATGFYSADGVHQHGFFYDSATGSLRLISDPNVASLELTQFLGVNDNGLAVGYYQTNDGSQHGFVYNEASSSYSFLDDPNAATAGFSITQITGINDSGEIAGFYIDPASGLQRGFVAEPTATPEPVSATLLLSGLAAIAFVGRIRC